MAEGTFDVVNDGAMTRARRMPGDGLAGRLLGGMLAMLLFVSPASAVPAAKATVETLHAALLDAMKNAAALGFEGRRSRLAPVVEQTYDMPFVTAVLLGTNWRALDDAARQRAIDTVTRYTVATYASRFDGFSGERFETISETPLSNGRQHVRTLIVESDGETVQLDYVLHDEGGAARIINVVADGVSDLALKRSEYAAVMKIGGFEGLMDGLERQIADLAKGGN